MRWAASACAGSSALFRGRTQSHGEAAAQAGVGLQHDSGMFGGLWTSRVDYSPHASREFELDYVIGYGRDVRSDWWADVMVRRYTFPESRDVVDYDYAEVSGGVRYRGFF